VEISDDAGTTFLAPLSAFSGDTSVNAAPTHINHGMVRDAGVDFNLQFNSNLVAGS